MVVQHNLTAMNANRMLGITTSSQAKVTEKLSSGYKVNRAADDAAGLAISEKMRRQIRGLTQATANAQDGISCLQTAEGALNEVHDMLQRMNELAIKAGNETLQSVDRNYIQAELNALRTEIDRVAETTTFNEQKLLDGNFSLGKRLQVGAEVQSPNQIRITISRMDWKSITTTEGYATYGAMTTTNPITKLEEGIVNVSLVATDLAGDDVYDSIRATVSAIKWALKTVSTMRSDMGAVQNRLEHTIANLKNVVENTTAAESAIRDTDMAEMMVKFANNNVLAQAGQAMLAQANQA
ncbi:MAG: flagellin, partial [Lachnospiraceae bacterium]|nr:flagellin [Lachnospiraceae bacterium]